LPEFFSEPFYARLFAFTLGVEALLVMAALSQVAGPS